MSGSKIRLYGSTSGYVELEAPAVAPDGVLTLPSTFAGIGSNVVSTTKTDVFTTTSTSLTAVTGLSASISPTTASSKILVIAKVQTNMSNNEVGGASLFRGATELDAGTPVGNRLGRSGSLFTNATLGTGELTLIYLDSPATTASTTYAVHVSVSGGTLRVNATSTDADVAANYRTSSTITVIEVAA